MHEHYMQLALKEAEKGLYFTKPNPAVGCLIVKNNHILATGYHAEYGQDHAEIAALKKINFNAKDCDIYVTLEPCAHQGQTPPCVDSIIKSGIKRIIAPFKDPNPLTNGNGFKKLQDNGVTVITNIQKEQAYDLNRFFMHYMKTMRPFVIAKWAMSENGQLVLPHQQWISHQDSRMHTHQLRQRVDAIMIGANTLRQDDPALTTRIDFIDKQQIRHPLRIVLTRKGNFDLSHQLLNDKHTNNTLIACSQVPSSSLVKHCQDKHIKVLLLHGDTELERLQYLIHYLGHQGIMSLVVEGGEMILRTFLKHGLVDELQCYIATTKKDIPSLNDFMPNQFSMTENKRIATDTFIRANKEYSYV